ncbi:hypothetical protein K2173_005475 [Erythroxylum novogranatense]|uniref:DUF4408 domain-containing protein n=1 Tax=Erythroxylum novogranatense TaxID=1862640 RepID=A0AAV8SJX6_9ROSI|nr:hypothetical protein K2173_005475 [Erythroxylum novogranatense]
MDLTLFQAIQASKSSKKHQVLGKIFLSCITVLTCTLLCSIPFWFPSLVSSLKIFFCTFVPRITPVLLGPKALFVVGNLIIIALIGESKFLAPSPSSATNLYYDEFINRKRSFQSASAVAEEKKDTELESSRNYERGGNLEGKIREKGKNFKVVDKEGIDGEDAIGLPTEELKKRADDFIAKVNRQRKLEARLLVRSSA